MIAAHENRRIQTLDISKNKSVSFTMHEAARLAVEANRAHRVGSIALRKLAAVWETVDYPPKRWP